MIFLNNLFGGAAGGEGGGTDYVNGNLFVTLPQTSYIHGDNFNTSGAVVTYRAPDGTETDVTSAASFDPSNGSTLTLDGQNTVRVSYTPSGKSTVYATQIITVAPIPQSLTVILADTGMRAGEGISYKGATVKALMSDRTEKDVSNANLVWDPLEGTVQSNDGTVNVKCTYTENGVSAVGNAQIVVTEKTLVRIAVTLGKTNFYYGDNFDTTNTVVTATYDDESTANVASRCEFLPENRSKLESHGTQTVLVTYTENSIKRTATATINVRPKPTKLNVTFTDSGFRQGDRLSYTNAKATLTWSDGSTSDVTNQVTWDPVPNTILDRTGSQNVTATYESGDWTISGKTAVNVTALVLQSIGANFTKKTYREGDSLDLTGAKVTALYDNGSTQDITASAQWSPSDGSTLKKGTNKVTCTYTENGVKCTRDVSITVAYVTGISITGVPTNVDANTTISYDNAHVTATYSDGSTVDVTDSVTWSPSDGHKMETTDTQIKATYRDNSGNSHTASVAITVNDVPTKLDVDISVNSYEVGDTLDTTGSQVVLTYASGRTEQLGVNDVTWNPAHGTELKKQGTTYITVTYTSGG